MNHSICSRLAARVLTVAAVAVGIAGCAVESDEDGSDDAVAGDETTVDQALTQPPGGFPYISSEDSNGRCTKGASGVNSWEQAFIGVLNAEREKTGRAKLTFVYDLQRRSDVVASYERDKGWQTYKHPSQTWGGDTCVGIRGWIGEIGTRCQRGSGGLCPVGDKSNYAFSGFWNSSNHRDIMMNPRARRVGLARRCDRAGQNCWVEGLFTD